MKDNSNPTLPTPSLPSSPPLAPQKKQDSNPEAKSDGQNTNTPPIQTGGLQNFMTTPDSIPMGTRSATGKLIATMLSILILIGGVMAGVFLVHQQQEIRSKASEEECLQSDNCIIIEDPEDSGSYQISGIIYDVYLTDENANIFGAGVTEDGCYRTVIEGDSLTWEKVGSESECENLVNIQVWMIEFPQESLDPVVSQCREVKIYDTDWNQFSTSGLNQPAPGDIIVISVTSSTTAGSIDQARFTINSQVQEPTTLKTPSTNQLYMEYIIPEETDRLDIEVELYHSTFGWF